MIPGQSRDREQPSDRELTRRGALLAIAAFLAAPAITCTRKEDRNEEVFQDLNDCATSTEPVLIETRHRGASASILVVPYEQHLLSTHQQHAITVAQLTRQGHTVTVAMESLPNGQHDAHAIEAMYGQFFQTPSCTIAPLELYEAMRTGRSPREVRNFDDYLEMNPILKLCHARPDIELVGIEDPSLLLELNKLSAAIGLVELAREKSRSGLEVDPKALDAARLSLSSELATLAATCPQSSELILSLADERLLYFADPIQYPPYGAALKRKEALNSAREAAMIENICHLARTGHGETVFVIIGADHRQALLDALKSQNISHISFRRSYRQEN
ncbi:MAG: hypothetical protein K1X79_10550 [Oligoflexia bacterium]|nr:hypothetical protein [Oligoflexia bacterium]